MECSVQPDDINKLRQEIDQLRLVSGRLAQGGDAKKGIVSFSPLFLQVFPEIFA